MSRIFLQVDTTIKDLEKDYQTKREALQNRERAAVERLQHQREVECVLIKFPQDWVLFFSDCFIVSESNLKLKSRFDLTVMFNN